MLHHLGLIKLNVLIYLDRRQESLWKIEHYKKTTLKEYFRIRLYSSLLLAGGSSEDRLGRMNIATMWLDRLKCQEHHGSRCGHQH